MKPYYETELGKLYCGDCLEILPELEPVDLVLTDPPYGAKWNCDYARWIKKGPNAQGGDTLRSYPPVIGDDKPFDPLPLFIAAKTVVVFGFTYFMSGLGNGSILVWKKRSSDGFLCNAEAAYMNKGNGVYVFNEPVERMQKFRQHPTQKPVNLMCWCIDKAGNPQIILDPFLGSGTTAVACERLGRKWIGIEISEKYCTIAANRIEQESRQLKLFGSPK